MAHDCMLLRVAQYANLDLAKVYYLESSAIQAIIYLVVYVVMGKQTKAQQQTLAGHLLC